MYDNAVASTHRGARKRPGVIAWQGVLIGIGAGMLCLLPHVLAGARLPLENLWRAESAHEEMPISLLPISHYYLWTLVAILAMGGALGGIASRLFGWYRGTARGSLSGGLFVLHVIVVAQGLLSLARGLQLGGEEPDGRAFLYSGVMLVVALVGVLFAQVLFWLVSSRSTVKASLGFAFMAVPSCTWLSALVAAFFGESGMPIVMVQFSRWFPAVFVGFVLAWCGIGSLRRLFVWVASLACLWLIPSTTTAIQYVVGSREVLTDPGGMLESGASVWSASLAVGTGPVLLAVSIGIAVTVFNHPGGIGSRASV